MENIKTEQAVPEVYADVIQSLNKETREFETYFLLKGKQYAEGTRLIPVNPDEFRAIYSFVFGMIKSSLEKQEKEKK